MDCAFATNVIGGLEMTVAPEELYRCDLYAPLNQVSDTEHTEAFAKHLTVQLHELGNSENIHLKKCFPEFEFSENHSSRNHWFVNQLQHWRGLNSASSEEKLIQLKSPEVLEDDPEPVSGYDFQLMDTFHEVRNCSVVVQRLQYLSDGFKSSSTPSGIADVNNNTQIEVDRPDSFDVCCPIDESFDLIESSNVASSSMSAQRQKHRTTRSNRNLFAGSKRTSNTLTCRGIAKLQPIVSTTVNPRYKRGKRKCNSSNDLVGKEGTEDRISRRLKKPKQLPPALPELPPRLHEILRKRLFQHFDADWVQTFIHILAQWAWDLGWQTSTPYVQLITRMEDKYSEIIFTTWKKGIQVTTDLEGLKRRIRKTKSEINRAPKEAEEKKPTTWKFKQSKNRELLQNEQERLLPKITFTIRKQDSAEVVYNNKCKHENGPPKRTHQSAFQNLHFVRWGFNSTDTSKITYLNTCVLDNFFVILSYCCETFAVVKDFILNTEDSPDMVMNNHLAQIIELVGNNNVNAARTYWLERVMKRKSFIKLLESNDRVQQNYDMKGCESDYVVDPLILFFGLFEEVHCCGNHSVVKRTASILDYQDPVFSEILARVNGSKSTSYSACVVRGCPNAVTEMKIQFKKQPVPLLIFHPANDMSNPKIGERLHQIPTKIYVGGSEYQMVAASVFKKSNNHFFAVFPSKKAYIIYDGLNTEFVESNCIPEHSIVSTIWYVIV